jgi:hypothetical protein
MLQHYVTPIQVNWDDIFWLMVEFAYSNWWQKSIKTLFLLNYGQHPTTHVNMKIIGSQFPTAKCHLIKCLVMGLSITLESLKLV